MSMDGLYGFCASSIVGGTVFSVVTEASCDGFHSERGCEEVSHSCVLAAVLLQFTAMKVWKLLNRYYTVLCIFNLLKERAERF